MFAQYKLYFYAAALIATFVAGWATRGWRYEANEKAAYVAAVEKANEASAKLEESLAKLDANKFVISREVRHEIEKPIFRECILPANSVRLYNESANPR